MAGFNWNSTINSNRASIKLLNKTICISIMNDVICRHHHFQQRDEKKLLIFIQHFSSSPSHFSFDEINILPTFCIHSVLRRCLCWVLKREWSHHCLALLNIILPLYLVSWRLKLSSSSRSSLPVCHLTSFHFAFFVLLQTPRKHSVSDLS